MKLRSLPSCWRCRRLCLGASPHCFRQQPPTRNCDHLPHSVCALPCCQPVPSVQRQAGPSHIWALTRTIFAVGTIGCPISEALLGAGLNTCHTVIHAERAAPPIAQVHPRRPLQALDAWVEGLESPSNSDTPCINWPLAVNTTGPWAPDGSPDSHLAAWCAKVLGLTPMLH